MNEQTRYRLTGAVFLLSIGIIVLPMIFDGEGVRVKQLPELSEPLPPMPTDRELSELEIPPAEVEQHLADQELTGGLLDKDGYHAGDNTRLGDPLLREPPVELQDQVDSGAGGKIARSSSDTGDSPVASAAPSARAEFVPEEIKAGGSVNPSSPRQVATAPPRRAPPVGPESSVRSLAKQAIWAVQLASFASPVNASALRDRLLGDGFEAWTSTARAASGVRTRVAIGPLLDRGDAERMRNLVSGRYNVSAIVVHMEP